jgi:hypothetical protein
VSCTTATACTAVGGSSTTTTQALAERWNGIRWTIQPTPNPSRFNFLTSVSCPTSTACTAVGHYAVNSSSPDDMFAEGWNGSKWTVQAIRFPSGSTSSDLNGVSCATPTVCIAVGSFTSSAGSKKTLAERWDGTTWTRQWTPNPAGTTSSELRAASCLTASACVAVGDFVNTAGAQVPIAESWDGTSWTRQPIAAPTGGTFNELTGVSCTTATACTAVGHYHSSLSQVTLAEAWNGSRWTIQSTPNPAGLSELTGVSCAAASTCTAVGESYSLGTFAPLAEQYS